MKLHNDLTSGNVTIPLIKFALPLIVSNLFQALYNAVDMFFVGKYIGTAGLAAVAICGPIMNIMIMTISGFSIGITIVTARYIGIKDLEQVKKTSNTAIAIYSILALLLTVFGLFFTPLILRIVKTPMESFDYASIYLKTIFAGMVFMLGYNLIGALQRGFGDSRSSMYFVIVAGFVNMILDYIFIKHFNMGVFGAAFATIISQGISFFLGVLFFRRNEHLITFSPKDLTIKIDSLKELLRVGVPMASQQFLLTISHTTLTGIVNTFGFTASAAYGIVTKIDSFAHLPSIAIGESVASFSSQNLGAGKPERTIEALKKSLILSISIILLVIILILNFSEQIVNIFDKDPGVVAYSKEYLKIIVFAYILYALIHPLMGFIRGTGNTFISLISVVINQYLVRIPLAIFLSRKMGFVGIAISIISAPAFASLFYFYFVISGKWKTSRDYQNSRNSEKEVHL